MSKIKEITISTTHTINIGNYESIKPGVSITFKSNGTDDPDEMYKKMYELFFMEVLNSVDAVEARDLNRDLSLIKEWANTGLDGIQND